MPKTKPTLTMKEIIADRRRKNRAFAKLSPAEKRVAIARDVIAQLGHQICAVTGEYWSVVLPEPEKLRGVREGGQFADVLAQIPQCNGCAIGSLFTAAVQRADRVKLFDEEANPGKHTDGFNVGFYKSGESVFFSAEARTYLVDQGLFDHEQLATMENVYENAFITGHAPKMTTKDLVMDVLADADGHFDADRLRLIMQNIVRNNGEFIPQDRTMLAQIRRIAKGAESRG